MMGIKSINFIQESLQLANTNNNLEANSENMDKLVADIKAIIDASRTIAHRAISEAMLEVRAAQGLEVDGAATKQGFREQEYGTRDFIRNPAVLQFLGIPAKYDFTNKTLDDALIDNLRLYLLELERGFAFAARQKRIQTDTDDFTIDLVFYNYRLRCFIILKFSKTKAPNEEIVRMEGYVRTFDGLQRGEDENPTVGILLCTEMDRAVAHYSVLDEGKELYASKYLLYLPIEEELVAEIEWVKKVYNVQESGIKAR